MNRDEAVDVLEESLAEAETLLQDLLSECPPDRPELKDRIMRFLDVEGYPETAKHSNGKKSLTTVGPVSWQEDAQLTSLARRCLDVSLSDLVREISPEPPSTWGRRSVSWRLTPTPHFP